MTEIESFISQERAKAFEEGKIEGAIEEATNCAEHCEKAREKAIRECMDKIDDLMIELTKKSNPESYSTLLFAKCYIEDSLLNK